MCSGTGLTSEPRQVKGRILPALKLKPQQLTSCLTRIIGTCSRGCLSLPSSPYASGSRDGACHLTGMFCSGDSCCWAAGKPLHIRRLIVKVRLLLPPNTTQGLSPHCCEHLFPECSQVTLDHGTTNTAVSVSRFPSDSQPGIHRD